MEFRKLRSLLILRHFENSSLPIIKRFLRNVVLPASVFDALSAAAAVCNALCPYRQPLIRIQLLQPLFHVLVTPIFLTDSVRL